MPDNNTTGYRTSRLKVKKYDGKTKKGKSSWKSECDCGNTCFHTTTELRALKTGSCNLLNKTSQYQREKKNKKESIKNKSSSKCLQENGKPQCLRGLRDTKHLPFDQAVPGSNPGCLIDEIQ